MTKAEFQAHGYVFFKGRTGKRLIRIVIKRRDTVVFAETGRSEPALMNAGLAAAAVHFVSRRLA